MSGVTSKITADVVAVLARLRLSLDPSREGIVGRASIDDKISKDVYLKLEGIRIDFRNQKYFKVQSSAPNSDHLKFLKNALVKLQMDENFIDVSGRLYYDGSTISHLSEDFSLNPRLLQNDIKSLEAIEILIDDLNSLTYEIVTGPDTQSPYGNVVRVLLAITPEKQEIGPVKFEIDPDGILYILEQPPKARPEDLRAISQARDELRRSGEIVLQALENSNCDRRIVERFSYAQEKILDRNNIISLGLANIHCENIYKKSKTELSESVQAMLEAHLLGIRMFLGQFTDWQRFSENAFASTINPNLAPDIASTLGLFANHLLENPEKSTPEVPQTLLAIKRFLEDPGIQGKSVLFGAWRTIENLVQKIYQYIHEFISKTLAKSSDALSEAIPRMLVKGLGGLVLIAAFRLSPLSEMIDGATWVKQGLEIIQLAVR